MLKRFFRLYSASSYLDFPGEVSCTASKSVSHTPPFLREVLGAFDNGGIFLDLTYGSGGHSHLILEFNKNSKVYAFDRDPNAIRIADRMVASKYSTHLKTGVSRFSELPDNLRKAGLSRDSVDGIIMDLGVSAFQKNESNKGFNFKGPLDLRMDSETHTDDLTASQVLQNIDEQSLMSLLKKYGKLKRNARLITNAILEARYMFHKFETVEELREVIRDALAFSDRRKSTFMNFEETVIWEDKTLKVLLEGTLTALRMLVNDEINELECAIRISSHYLKEGGTLLVLTKHPAEEKVLERCFKEVDYDPKIISVPRNDVPLPWQLINNHPLRLSRSDQLLNPDQSGSKLYGAIKMREMLTFTGRP